MVKQEYEIERLIDFIRFEEAYEQFYHYKNKEFAGIFTSARFRKNARNTYVTSRYYFKVKWLGFDRNSTTWEPEESIPSAVYLGQFKRLNNLEEHLEKIEVSFELKQKRGYCPLQDVQIVEKTADEPVNLSLFSPVLLDAVDNGRFGMVPIPAGENLNQSSFFFKLNSTYYFVKNAVYNTGTSDDVESLIKTFHHENKCFIQGYIRHENIVSMLDSFYNFDPSSGNVRISSVFEDCPQALRWKITNEGVNWKRMTFDVLKGLAYIHTHGIHQGISIDNILFGKNGQFKISHFNDFTFSKSIDAMNVKSVGVELAPRKYGLDNQFDFSVDIYALAIVALQCSESVLLVQRECNTLADIEEKISQAMENLPSDEDRHMIRMMLKARLLMHQGTGSYRFSAHSLSCWPVLYNSNMVSVECYFLKTMDATPIIDRAYYAPNDSVADVTNRFAAFYGCSLQTDYRMLCSTNFDPSCSADILSRHENFKAVVDNETTLGRKKFLIVPLLKPSVAPDHLMQKYVILYRQELGGFPIIIESPTLTPPELLTLLKREVVSEEYKLREMGLFAEELDNYEDDIPKYSENSFLLKITDLPENAIKSRLSTLEDIKKPLTGDLLRWTEIAGIHSLFGQKNAEPIVKRSRKRSSSCMN
ncbi:hypothetical protein GCK72_006617 [Caenorhabditis remanei]|uniref:Protein kinase domain-containing protein n=1 Tax=Caenorhabditis remanei TaxID=31234 RepID=A0A6A5HH56_CAERE|nr:hypothetical protein GCK72_006617 [Caenorhabditis remanei]KAF1766659.1 hypothetical protein GCK72_006617 [Caenorhabditis remanei]